MTEEHVYNLHARVTRPMFAGVKMHDMEEFEVTTLPDWWPEAPEGFHTPHRMLLAASASCQIVMMFRTAGALHTKFKDATVDATGTMGEKDGVWRFDEILLKVRVVIEDESYRDKVQKAVDMAHKTCPIGNSLSTPVKVETEIVVG
ncbi:MAG: OsmC family protein [Candidatus Thorarchaeota archaeon]